MIEKLNKYWKACLDNHKQLESCQKHHFYSIEDKDSAYMSPHYKCASCGGVIDHLSWRWYTRGVEDGSKTD